MRAQTRRGPRCLDTYRSLHGMACRTRALVCGGNTYIAYKAFQHFDEIPHFQFGFARSLLHYSAKSGHDRWWTSMVIVLCRRTWFCVSKRSCCVCAVRGRRGDELNPCCRTCFTWSSVVVSGSSVYSSECDTKIVHLDKNISYTPTTPRSNTDTNQTYGTRFHAHNHMVDAHRSTMWQYKHHSGTTTYHSPTSQVTHDLPEHAIFSQPQPAPLPPNRPNHRQSSHPLCYLPQESHCSPSLLSFFAS